MLAGALLPLPMRTAALQRRRERQRRKRWRRHGRFQRYARARARSRHALVVAAEDLTLGSESLRFTACSRRAICSSHFPKRFRVAIALMQEDSAAPSQLTSDFHLRHAQHDALVQQQCERTCEQELQSDLPLRIDVRHSD
jgi:hypothetical protein